MVLKPPLLSLGGLAENGSKSRRWGGGGSLDDSAPSSALRAQHGLQQGCRDFGQLRPAVTPVQCVTAAWLRGCCVADLLRGMPQNGTAMLAWADARHVCLCRAVLALLPWQRS